MENPILARKRAIAERLEKSFNDGINVPEEVELEKAHYDGEEHPNGKWVWVASAAGGKGDWRTKGSRTHTAHMENEKKFKQNFKDAQEGMLQKIIDGKVQAGAHERKWAQDILDERKKGQSNDAAAKKIIDLMKISNSKYSDIKKVVAFKTDKGNWAMDYDGANTGLVIGKDHLSEAELKAAGVKIEGGEPEKKKADPKQDKAAKDAGFKDYEEMSGYQSYVTAKNLLKKPSMKLKSKEADRKELEKQVADYEKEHADVIAARGGKKGAKSKSADEIDETTIDQAEYDSQLRMAKQVDDSARSMAKNIIQGNIDKTKKKLQETISSRPGAKVTITNLQKDLTKYISQKKAVEDAIADSSGNSAKEKIASKEKTETKKTNDGNFKGMKFTEILDSLDEWEDDDWNNQELNEKLTEAIKGAIKKEGIDEKKFKEIAKKYQGLDLVYEDYTGEPDSDFAKLLNPLDDWTDDDWNDKKKNDKLTSDIKSLIMKHKMSESDFSKMAKKYQGLDLVYTDYVPKNSDLYKKYNGKA